jgi:biopolymer transport protein ExbB/TolQ
VKNVDPATLASDISFALITTAVGLFITIPCLLAVAKIGISLRNFESMVTVGLNRFLDVFAATQKQLASRQR